MPEYSDYSKRELWDLVNERQSVIDMQQDLLHKYRSQLKDAKEVIEAGRNIIEHTTRQGATIDQRNWYRVSTSWNSDPIKSFINADDAYRAKYGEVE